VVKTPFYGGYGLIAADSIPKAAFHAFRVLHQLGNERLAVDSDSVLATRRADGALEIAVWNYAAPEEGGAPVEVNILLRGLDANRRHASIARVDAEHGSPIQAWQDMGRPAWPTREQIAALKKAARPGDPEAAQIGSDGSLKLRLPAHGLAVVEVP